MKAALAMLAAVAAVSSAAAATLQEMIDAAKPGDMITLPDGVWREKVTIPREKRALAIVHEGPGEAVVEWGDYASLTNSAGEALGTFRTWTMKVEADDVRLAGLWIRNTASDANVAAGGRGVGQAVALHIEGDGVEVAKCRISGHQDTLYVSQGVKEWAKEPEYTRYCGQHFEECLIEGTVDFIFGQSRAVFDRCEIRSLLRGYITAAATPEGREGFLFRRCRITAAPGVKTLLGRPWRPHAQVVFDGCVMDDCIKPEGWSQWRPNDGTDKTAFFAEYNCTGTGAETSRRLPWIKIK